ncbi:hypothetical protein [Marilutibacter aestuarii]|uniref:UrcA family protein n=1 Tax=Marilutibacter aestuarii TaxID=1706195 RepID=A0A508ASK2_9GAMM|nr:hypothetical protein [Lysobacter aestuarii]TQD51461.1 hypothetical protein FKV25_01165 [Lysobacter aestuarii]
MDRKPFAFPRDDRRALRTRGALRALACLVAVTVAAPVFAQAIDEPGVHLVDPGYARTRPAMQGSADASLRVAAAQACTLRPGGRDAGPGDCVAPTDAKARQRNLEAARRSGVELGTHVRDLNPPRPAQRSH